MNECESICQRGKPLPRALSIGRERCVQHQVKVPDPYFCLPLNLSSFLSFHLLTKSFCLATEKTKMFSNQQCWHFKCKYHGNVLSITDVRENNHVFPKPLLNCHKLSPIFFSGAANWHGKQVSLTPLPWQSPARPKSWSSHDLSMKEAAKAAPARTTCTSYHRNTQGSEELKKLLKGHRQW